MTELVRRPPLEPSADNLAKVERLWSVLGPPLGLLLRWWQQLEIEGREHVPRTGPVLVLANHVTFYDPFTLMLAVGRPIHMMAGEGLFDDPVLGLLARWSGAVPRKKRVADAGSVRRLVRWAKAGGAVGLFPEGQRTWDGDPLPLIPGIGRLVQATGAPVVTVRLVGGYRQSPRWAAVQRRARVRIEVDPPREWGRAADPSEIEAWLAERLRVDPQAGGGWPCRGSNLAEGLPNLLYRCPECAGLDTLRATGDLLDCRACKARWRLDVDHRLLPMGDGREHRVPEVARALRLRSLAEAADWASGDPEAVVLRSEPMELLDITEAVARTITRGSLVLTPDELRVEADVGVPWRLPLARVAVFDVYRRRRLQLRDVGGAAYEVVLPHESVLKWEHLGEALRRQAREVPA